MADIEVAVQYGIDVANDNSKGYSQSRRNGGIDEDCSTVVLNGCKKAGFNVSGATYTGDMLIPLLKAGFINVVSSVNTKTGEGLIRGDILLRPKTSSKNGHTTFYIGNGQIVQANADYDGKVGDSSGKEICIRSYYNSGWPYVLRYKSSDASTTPTKTSFKVARILMPKDPNMVGEDVRAVQTALTALGFKCGRIDGSFGDLTEKAVRAFQISRGLREDAQVGKKTVTCLGGVWTGN